MWPVSTQKQEKVEFPNLFIETVQPTIASIMVFAFADIRRIAREKENLHGSGNIKVLDLPLSGTEIIRICKENSKVLQQNLKQKECKTLDYVWGDFLETHGADITSVDTSTIEHCGDGNALNECVHTIISNSQSKQVTLAFRGSTTMNDWLTDAKVVSGDVANPLYNLFDDTDDQPECLGVHLGFRDYLYDVRDPLLPSISLQELQSKMKKGLSKANKVIGDNIPSSTARDGSSNVPLSTLTKDSSPSNDNVAMSAVYEEPAKKNKIDVILDQVQEVMDANPGYKLYITGHSLGGALALLTSIEAAVRFATPEIPVTCVTIANPRVGDNRFRHAIQTLENQKRLRCLTVHNVRDLVPAMPNRICRCDWCNPNKFCLVGMEMILEEHSFTIDYHSEEKDTKRKELRAEVLRVLMVMFCWPGMAKQHDYREYLNRLVAQKDTLSSMYLNDLYKEQGIDFS